MTVAPERHAEPIVAPSSPLASAVELRAASLGYGGAPAVADATLSIGQGAFAGIVGPSGAGKTTLLRALLGAVPSVQGEVRVLGQLVRHGHPPARTGYVPQLQTVNWDFPITVSEVVLLGRAMRSGPWPWPRRQDRMAAEAMLERLGIGGLGTRHIRELSGGQQQRVFLARALISNPALLLLDEPTSGIDIKTRDEVLHLLAEINAEGVTIIVTTHELNAVAAHLPEVICVNRRIVAHGNPAEVFTPALLSQTYGGEMRVIRQDGMLLVADAISHHTRELFHHRHLHADDAEDRAQNDGRAGRDVAARAGEE